MQDWLFAVVQWLSLSGEINGFNAASFIVIYFGTVPTFWYGLYRAGKNLRNGVSPLTPFIIIGLSWIAPYVYLIYAGESVPLYFWIGLTVLMSSSYYSVRRRLKQISRENQLNMPTALPVLKINAEPQKKLLL